MAGPIAMPIMTAVSSLGVRASSTIDANSQMAANMATISTGCRNRKPLAGDALSLWSAARPSSEIRLFVVVSGRRAQHEMAESGRNRPVRIVLPGPRLEGDDAPALLHDRDIGKAVQRAAGA